MNDMQADIRSLEQELEATQQRCHLIERTIEGLREIYGEPESDAKPKRKYKRRAGAPKKKKKRAGRQTDRPTEQKVIRRAARSLPEFAVNAKILEALRKRSPLKPNELALNADVSVFVMRAAVKALEKERLVEVTGKTNSRQIHLVAGKRAAKEAL